MPDSKEVLSKIPGYGSFLKNPLHVAAYIFLSYFVYKEFVKPPSDCSIVIAKYEIVIKKYEERITKLENYVDIKNGVINEVKTNLDANQHGGGK